MTSFPAMFMFIIGCLVRVSNCFLLLGKTYTVPEYTLGLLLSDRNPHRAALRALTPYSVQHFNNNSQEFKLNLKIENYDPFSLYGLVEATCRLAPHVFAVISPDGSNSVATQADILSPLQIPLLSIDATDTTLVKSTRNTLLLFSPSDQYQALAILSILEFYNWREFSIVASDTSYGVGGVNMLQHLMSRRTQYNQYSVKSISFFTPSGDREAAEVDGAVQRANDSLSRVIVLFCEGIYARKVFEQAYQMGLMSPGFVWIVTEAITGAPQAFSYGGFYPHYYEGLIGIALSVNTSSQHFRNFKTVLSKRRINTLLEPSYLSPSVLKTYDAVQIAGKALNSKIRLPDHRADCGSRRAWNNGTQYFSSLKETTEEGVSGRISFTDDGILATAEYHVVNFVSPGLFVNIGKWTTAGGLRMQHDKESENVQFLGGERHHPFGVPNSLNGRNLRLGVTHNPPFAIRKENCTGSNSCWDGICPDTVATIAAELNFTYQFIEPDDKSFGVFDHNTEKWNGLIGDMLASRTDMITMDVSVSFERKHHMDFTVSFMDSGIRLVVRGESGKNNLFFFLSPFGEFVWIAIVVAIFIMALLQNLFNKLSPYGEYAKNIHAMQVCECGRCSSRRELTSKVGARLKDYDSRTCRVEQEHGKNKDAMSFYNALWVIGGGFVGQGGDSSPSSPSGRFILITWWFFVMMITSMYSANLTAFMTLDKIGVSVDSAKDLLNQNKYKWGILDDSFVESLLAANINPEYRKLVAEAERVSTPEEGFSRVRDGFFVFIDESPAISFNLMGECNIFYIGGEIQTFDYAFGMPKNSPYGALMNAQMIRLREQGYFDNLWEKWDKKPDAGNGCSAHSDVGSDETLHLATLKGIFFFLCFGTLASLVSLILEVVFATIQDKNHDTGHGTSFGQRLARRLYLKYRDMQTEWFSRNNQVRVILSEHKDMVKYDDMEMSMHEENCDQGHRGSVTSSFVISSP